MALRKEIVCVGFVLNSCNVLLPFNCTILTCKSSYSTTANHDHVVTASRHDLGWRTTPRSGSDGFNMKSVAVPVTGTFVSWSDDVGLGSDSNACLGSEH